MHGIGGSGRGRLRKAWAIVLGADLAPARDFLARAPRDGPPVQCAPIPAEALALGSRSIIMKRRHQGMIAAALFAAAIALGHGTAAAQQLAPGSVEIAPRVSFSHWNVKREG